MALTRTAAELVADVRNRTDHLVGNFRADAVLMRYLSESCRSLVSMVVDEYEELYWCNEATVNTTPSAKTSVLPVDAWKNVMMRVSLGGKRDKIRKASVDDIDVEETSAGGWGSGGLWPKYRMMGRKIYWTPIPRAVHAVTLFYVPTTIFFNVGGSPISEFTTGTDYFDGIFGWEQLAVLDAGIKFLHDERKDASDLESEWTDRWAEVSAAAANQDATEPPRVRDTWSSGEER